MKFTQDNLRSIIDEEIEAYLDEADDDDPHAALRASPEEMQRKLAKLYAYIEELEQDLIARGIDPDGPTIGASGTQIVDRLADTPVGEKPRPTGVTATRFINSKK